MARPRGKGIDPVYWIVQSSVMTTEPLLLNGARLIADLSGALYWPDRSILIVSDMHLEKGSSFAAKGIPLPPYDTAVTLKRLAALCAGYKPHSVLCLGDNFHDSNGLERMGQADRALLEKLIETHNWIWIAGNHDPYLPEDLSGRRTIEETIGTLTFRHEASREAARGEISGHYHPSARVQTRQRYVSGRCFAYNNDKLIMPAFGALSGGLSVHDKAIRAVLGKRFDILFLGSRRIFRFPADKLR